MLTRLKTRLRIMIGQIHRASPLTIITKRGRYHEKITSALIEQYQRSFTFTTASNASISGVHTSKSATRLMRNQHGMRALSSQVRYATFQPLRHAINTVTGQKYLHSSNRKARPTEINSINTVSSIPPLLLPGNLSTFPIHRDEDLMKLKHGSAKHSCLASYLAYVKANNKSTISTFFYGTRYEYIVSKALTRLGFNLTRSGRSNDAGIDLIGHWNLPAVAQPPVLNAELGPLKVILQCKRHSRILVPQFVRELEGAYGGAPRLWQGNHTIGFLVSPEEASKGTIEAMMASRRAMGFIRVQERKDGMSGRVTQMLWNWRAKEIGLQGVGATLFHRPEQTFEENGETRELVLTWNGWAVEDMSVETISLDEPVEKVPKKKGRPRKTATDANQVQGSLPVVANALKPRGRPKKIKDEP